MRSSVEETAIKHERILDAASQMFRKRGFEGVSVAEIMKAAGLTHGAFPAHFSSKEEVMKAGVERALQEMLKMAEGAAGLPEPKKAFLSYYLSAKHRDNPENGCVMTTLAPEIARKSGAVRSVFNSYVATVINQMTKMFYPRRRQGRIDAIATLSAVVGAITLARAVDDPALSEEILSSVRAHFEIDPE